MSYGMILLVSEINNFQATTSDANTIILAKVFITTL